jgi:hypothetical protein
MWGSSRHGSDAAVGLAVSTLTLSPTPGSQMRNGASSGGLAGTPEVEAISAITKAG